MNKIHLIGCAPSSGSTLLADLLDSVDQVYVGPEFEFFCDKRLYEFEKFKQNNFRTGYITDVCVSGIFPRYDKLGFFGFNRKDFLKSLEQARGLSDLFIEFSKVFVESRGGNVDEAIVFEKTPQNINAIGQFLNADVNNKFIYVVRNPLFVYNSMRNRNWGQYVSSVNWLLNVAQFWEFKDHPRVLVVKYEDLVQNPSKEVNRVLSFVGSQIRISSEELLEKYRLNEFRKSAAKNIKTWSIKEKSVVVDGNLKKLSNKVYSEFLSMKAYGISAKYAEVFNLEKLRFDEAIAYFGYTFNSEIKPKGLKFDFKDFKLFGAKYFRSILQFERPFINPFSLVKVVEKLGK